MVGCWIMSDNGVSWVFFVDEIFVVEFVELIIVVLLVWLFVGDYEWVFDLWLDFVGSDLVIGLDGLVVYLLYCWRM